MSPTMIGDGCRFGGENSTSKRVRANRDSPESQFALIHRFALACDADAIKTGLALVEEAFDQNSVVEQRKQEQAQHECQPDPETNFLSTLPQRFSANRLTCIIQQVSA